MTTTHLSRRAQRPRQGGSLHARRGAIILPLLLLLVLLSACTLPGVHTGNQTTNATATPASVPASAKMTTCPDYLQRVMTCLTPYTIREAYGVEPLAEQGWTGKGQTVIDVVSFGSPTLQQDMKVYDQTFNLPPVNLQIMSPLHEAQSGSQKDISGWAGETTLDVQIIHAIAPDAKIVVLTSPVDETEGTIGLPEFRQLVQYALNNKLGYIFSQSWGASELTLQNKAGQQELQKWNTLFQQATTQQKATFFSSSGDEGATDYADLNAQQVAKVPTTSFAADSPWVTAVGGTTILPQGNNTFTERVWNSGDGASGGGFSRFYAEPSYQKTLPNSMQNELQNRRGVPDVAAAADPSTGLAIYEDGQWTMAGGTSAAAPVWAGIMAIANQRAGHPLGFINPTLYKLAAGSSYNQDFHDITEGDNHYAPTNVSGYSAAPGWDPTTGLGTPKANKLIPDLISAMK
jgi:subtilase family serine protease